MTVTSHCCLLNKAYRLSYQTKLKYKRNIQHSTSILLCKILSSHPVSKPTDHTIIQHKLPDAVLLQLKQLTIYVHTSGKFPKANNAWRPQSDLQIISRFNSELKLSSEYLRFDFNKKKTIGTVRAQRVPRQPIRTLPTADSKKANYQRH